MTIFLSTTDRELVQYFLTGQKIPGIKVQFGPSFHDGPWDLAVVPVSEFLLLRSQYSLMTQGLLWMPYGPAHLLQTAWVRGAWDYLKEPWELTELELRVSRLLSSELSWESHGLQFQVKDGKLCQGEKTASLSCDEEALLRSLLLRRGSPVSRHLLEQNCLRDSAQSRALSMQISRLRKKFRGLGWMEGDPIPADRHQGYRLP